MYLEPGQKISTTIISISKDSVFLDLNAKSEGILPLADIQDEDGTLTAHEGDSIDVYFIGTKDGEMMFTTRIKSDNADLALLENAYRHGTPVEGHVEKEIKGGFEVTVGSARAFCPFSQMGFREKKEPKEYVGRNLPFRITEFKEEGRNLLVSNRVILEEEHQMELKKLANEQVPGAKVMAKVVSLQSFGAFVEVNGFKALLPISEISRERVADIADVLSVGDEFEVLVLKADWERERLSVSRKALLADPWDSAAEKYPEGTKITGKIARISNFGIFIELESGLDGLVHISELENIKPGTNIQKLYKIGDKMSVIVKEVNQAARRISLKPSSSKEQDQEAAKYMKGQADAETYNPFALLLKKKK
ncbi:MAG: S1 RNA-binding domain-containing protein [Spirochaetia bacterium]|nr:S1 RNA-binding domain-containing protein [Spirochaetia bacterium]